MHLWKQTLLEGVLLKKYILIAVLILAIPVAYGTYQYMTPEDIPENLGPALGSNLPASIQLPDSSGALQGFDNLTGAKGSVIVFYRSADWCPFCKLQLIGLNGKNYDEIKARGYKVAAISYDSVETLATFDQRWDIDYPLLSDADSRIINAFGLRNENVTSGKGAGIPHPIILITDASGVVTAKLYEQSYAARPSVEAVLEAIDAQGIIDAQG